MKIQRNKLLTGFTVLLAFSLLWDLYLYTLESTTTFWNFFYNIVYGSMYFLGGAFSVCYGYRFSSKSNLGKMLIFLGLGLLSFWGGNMIWAYYAFFLDTAIPFPSYSDLSYMLLYPLMTVGTIYLMRVYQMLVTKQVLRDSVIICIVSFLVIFGFFASPDLSEKLPFIQKFINVYYPFGDVVTLSIALIALRIGGGKMHPSLYIFSLGLVMQAVGDLLFTYRNAIEVYWNGDISDFFYTLASYFMSIGLFEIVVNLQNVSVPANPQIPVSAPVTSPPASAQINEPSGAPVRPTQDHS